MKRLRNALCVLLAFLLVLTGLNLQKHMEKPAFGAAQPVTGVAALLSAEGLPHADVCFMEESGSRLASVLRQQSTSNAELRCTAAVCGAHFCEQPWGPVQRLRAGDLLPTRCWHTITSHIHRTRRKRC